MRIWLGTILLFWVFLVSGQTPYYMTNGSTSDCTGILYDSEAGDKAGHYDHDEDYIFTICINGDATITLTFDSFFTEKSEDYLNIYDGADTNATRIANRLSGKTSIQPITSTDSCITFYFHSDASVSNDGFKITWKANVEPLKSPQFIEPLNANCEEVALGFKLDTPIPCDSIKASDFEMTGAKNITINSVTAIGCIGGFSDSFRVALSSPMNVSGNYDFAYTMVLYDQCDSAWNVGDTTTISITDCPITIALSLDEDSICNGDCAEVTATVTGGDPSSYNYQWSHGITGQNGPHQVCLTSSQYIILQVSDGNGTVARDSIWLEVLDIPTAPPDTMICRGAGTIQLTGLPGGGNWTGTGITDAANGIFNPLNSGVGGFTVRYFVGKCPDQMTVTVVDVNAGAISSACPGTSAFQLQTPSPVGGVFSGVNTTPVGQFNPLDTGAFTVYYTWQGCTDSTQVLVYPIHIIPYDTTCLSTSFIDLPYTPVGGQFSGTGVDVNGRFYPPWAGAGDHQIVYQINGCSDTSNIHVVDIDAGRNQVFCPDGGLGQITTGSPVGGYWKGFAITDSSTGAYDPSLVYSINRTNYNDTLTYVYGGCEDRMISYIRVTRIYNDSHYFCPEDPSLLLNWASVRRSPGGGNWQGLGTSGNYFDPQVTGPGGFQITYSANNCVDSMIMYIRYPSNIQRDTQFCETEPDYALYTTETGGTWSGSGIIDSQLGVFSPSSAGVGFHQVYFTSKHGCLDSLLVEVIPKPVIQLGGLLASYCFKDEYHTISALPAGGLLWGDGVIGNRFNADSAGTGTHRIYYSQGPSNCFSVDSLDVNVLDTLDVSLSADNTTICRGESAILSAKGSLGNAGPYTFRWSTGETTSDILVTPNQTSFVHLEINDGCSNPHFDSIVITVNPKVTASVLTSDTLCFGENGFAEVIPAPAGNYDITWNTSPPVIGARLDARVKLRYAVSMVNTSTGCRLDTLIIIPGYDKVNADFITIPSTGRCINVFSPEVNFINMSEGGTRGYWDFSEGSRQNYDPFHNPTHSFSGDTTLYNVTLWIENDNGCSDSITKPICMEDSVYLLIPNSFTPNGDQINDVFRIRGSAVTTFKLVIFNRWGQNVFESDDVNFEWDGTADGKPVQPGVYSFYAQYKGTKSNLRQASGTIYIHPFGENIRQ